MKHRIRCQSQDCTHQILAGIADRKREVVMTAKGKLIPWGKVLAPGLLDWIALRTAKR